MAWKPWYVRAAEMDSAEERVEFIQGVFGPRSTTSGPGSAATFITSFLAGWGIAGAIKDRKK